MWTEFDKVDQSRRTSERDQDEVCKGDFSNLMNVARDRVETDMGGWKESVVMARQLLVMERDNTRTGKSYQGLGVSQPR